MTKLCPGKNRDKSNSRIPRIHENVSSLSFELIIAHKPKKAIANEETARLLPYNSIP